jgi:hypothetical protein
VIGLSLVASYGFAMTTFSLSIDDEVFLQEDHSRVWITSDRFGIFAIKFALDDVFPLPFFNTFISCLVLGLSALAWCFLFVRASEGRLARSMALIVFAVFFSTLPANAYYLTFDIYNIEVSFGHLFAALGVFSLYVYKVERRSVIFLFLTVLLFTACIAIYQSFVFVLFAGLFAAMMVASAATIARDTVLRFLILGCALILLATVLHFGLSRALRPQQAEYIDVFFNWGKLDRNFIIAWLTRTTLATLSGEGFVGGVSVPIALCAGVAGALTCVFKGRQLLLVPTLMLGLVAAPFLLSLALGTAMPLRTQQTLSLAFGSFFLLFALAFAEWRFTGPILAIVGIWFFFSNGQANTRLFLTEYLTYQRDVVIANEIARRLTDRGWEGEPLAIVATGRLPAQKGRFLVQSETFGGSFLDWDNGSRLPYFMLHLGYTFLGPTAAERQLAQESAKTMPSWPSADSVRLAGKLAVVKLGAP